jgi:WD40 repeat protein
MANVQTYSVPYKKNFYASLPSTTRGLPVHLGGDPKGKNILYCTGNSVVIRDLTNPLLCDQYTEHAHAPTVARYAPSGYYIASGDSAGTVRIWDCVGADRICKLEVNVIFGAITDISWSPDSKRLCVVGDGKEKYGRVFFAETGASVGEISGASKKLTTCDMKQTRPFRLITGSEDNSVQWLEGPPFKWKKNLTDHTRFVNCVRFNAPGTLFASAGQDKKVFLYDGKTAEKKGELPQEHKMGVYSLSWNADGTQLLTCSGDKSVKLWDVEAQKCVSTFQFPNHLDYMQLGVLWQGDYMVSLGLNGYFIYLDKNKPDTPQQVLKGHNKFITSMAYDKSTNNLYTGSYDAVVTRWNVDTGANDVLPGKGHTNQINGMSISGGKLVTCAMDDSFRVTPLDGEFGDSTSVDAPATDCATGAGDLAISVTMKSVYLFRGQKEVSKVSVPYNPKCTAINPASDTAVVGGADDFKVHVYSLGGDALKEIQVLDRHTRQVTSAAFSPCGKYLATGDQKNEIIVWNTGDWSIVEEGWCFHTGSVKSIAWSPNSERLASGSLDQCVFIWSMSNRSERIRIPNAHRGGVNVVAWLDDTTVASAGQDCAWKSWSV